MGVAAVQVFDGDGVDHGPIKISSDATWRIMQAMVSTRKRGQIVLPSEKFVEEPLMVSMQTQRKNNIYQSLIARDVTVMMSATVEHELMTYFRDRWRKERKLVNLIFKQIEDSVEKFVYCKGCKLISVGYEVGMYYTDVEAQRVELRAMSTIPIKDPESFP